MYILNDIAYADNFFDKEIKIKEIKIVAELCMLVTFSSGEKRIFDVKKLTQYPAYKKLENFDLFKNAYIENGIIVWDNGLIDISPNTVYKNSYEYDSEVAI